MLLIYDVHLINSQQLFRVLSWLHWSFTAHNILLTATEMLIIVKPYQSFRRRSGLFGWSRQPRCLSRWPERPWQLIGTPLGWSCRSHLGKNPDLGHFRANGANLRSWSRSFRCPGWGLDNRNLMKYLSYVRLHSTMDRVFASHSAARVRFLVFLRINSCSEFILQWSTSPTFHFA